MKSSWLKKSVAAVGAPLAALTVTGVFATSVAAQENTTSDTPGSAEALISEVQNQGPEKAELLQGAATKADGKLIAIVNTGDDQKLNQAVELKTQLEDKGVEVLTSEKGLTALAGDDLVGGAGFATPGAPTAEGLPYGLCSVGFSAWSPKGDPAFITAGHCFPNTYGDTVYRTDPRHDEAFAGAGSAASADFAGVALGTKKFAQFGGPNGTAGAEGDKNSIDIAAVDVTDPSARTLPEVTDWSTASTGDLSGSTSVVTSVGAAQIGQSATRSGRTTKPSTGAVSAVDGWMQVDNKFVHGFMLDASADHGDSGGSIVQGTKAVGVVSGGGDVTYSDGTKKTIVWGASLVDSLPATGGYSIALHLDAPKVTTPAGAKVELGSPITGTAPANTKLVVENGGKTTSVDVDGNGNWSFPVQAPAGKQSFTLHVTDKDKGFNKSATVETSVEAVVPAPAITTPADGSTVAGPLSVIEGTGVAGATVTLTGDVTQTTTVGADGKWSVKLDNALDYSNDQYTVNAVQKLGEVASEQAATSKFKVVPAAPVIENPINGTEFAHDQLPTTISGTGIAGAELAVTVRSEPQTVTTEVGEDGKWSIAVPAGLEAGQHSITAVQTVDAVASLEAQAAFSIQSAPTPGGTDQPGGDQQPAGDKKPAAPAAEEPVKDGTLAHTGAEAGQFGLLAAGAAAIALAGAGVLLARRRSSQR
ncbi:MULTISPECIES: Ig-like domain-containing protein [unclassified Pseudoclavibacter]|uniref:Ig-like domain-containing protein n=1 Tax=unclassified Pseudoclavibacter TaxID=2615177 RepID=UPI00130196B9|nr:MULTISPECIES: Ig-like domain-containing protein [unclassified Pseudoclavibacter]KAB1647147.1 LPXTG cell wall anchor domain-containing protein [Pseudoclavibacter sp. CFCC 14310]KAB1662888.1 LPXTG cell wall anchor domain-containing protein [Pseudoclavibacter sp. CFCC 13611]